MQELLHTSSLCPGSSPMASVLLLTLLTLPPIVTPSEMGCSPGQYLDKKTNLCVKCMDGTFMDEFEHTWTECKKCAGEPGRGSRKKVAKECTIISDVVWECEQNSYSDKFGGLLGDFNCFSCKTCEKDERELAPCWQFNDTVCVKDIVSETNHTIDPTSESESPSENVTGSSTGYDTFPIPLWIPFIVFIEVNILLLVTIYTQRDKLPLVNGIDKLFGHGKEEPEKSPLNSSSLDGTVVNNEPSNQPSSRPRLRSNRNSE